MKRWLWLLMMPWMVQMSTHPACPDCDQVKRDCTMPDGTVICACAVPLNCGTTDYNLLYNRTIMAFCTQTTPDNTCDYVEDQAAAYNAAHQARTMPSESPIDRESSQELLR